jgi:predicted permease
MPNLKLALRTLWKTPFVTLVAILSLSLGIGANGAIFSLFDQMLLRSLPVREPGQLVNLGSPGPKSGSTSCGNAGGCDEVFSYPMFRDLEREQTVFLGLAAHVAFGSNLAFEGQTMSGEGLLVSGSYFPTLGLTPHLGRLLDPGDDRVVGESQVVVLSHNYWRRRFGENLDILNAILVVNGQSLTIVGVAPPGFRGTTLGNQPHVFVPITLRGLMSPGFDAFENRRSYWAYLFGRLNPGATLEEARAALNVHYSALLSEVEAPLQDGMSETTLATFRAKEITMAAGAKGQSSLHNEARAPLLILFAVAGVVLLIACANVANLLLARSASRGGEMGIRLSIGASRSKLIAQLLAESCLLATFGALAGLVVARWTLVFIGSLLPPEAASTLTLALDGKTVAFAAVLALGTGILFGLFPALQSTRLDLAALLKGQTGQPSGNRAAVRFRTVLITTQIALATFLLVSAGLFTKSLFNVSRIDLGLEVDHLLTFAISPELNGYTPERSLALFIRAEEELAALPGVQSVTVSLVPVLAGSQWGSSVVVEGFEADADTNTSSRYSEVGAGYFRTMGVPLLTGREFTTADSVGTPRVAIVNEVFAEKFDLGRQAVGKRMGFGRSEELDVEIVGLIQNAKYSQVKNEIPPLFFTPYRQDEQLGSVYFYVRTALAPKELLASVAGVIARLDPNLPVEELKTMPQQVRENIFMDRVMTTLSAAFAALATLLAAVGLYGVLSFTVAQRTRELGLRMALGADGARVLRMVLGQVARMTIFGAVIGVAAAIGLGYAARSLLFEIAGYDPLVLGGSSLLLALVALISGLVPAVRASRVDPMIALRYE